MGERKGNIMKRETDGENTGRYMWGKYRQRRMKNKLKMRRIGEMRIFVVLRMGEAGCNISNIQRRRGGGTVGTCSYEASGFLLTLAP